MFKQLRDWWMGFVHVLGKVQTTILLSVVYHVALGPIALIARIARADFLGLGGKGAASYATTMPRISSTRDDAAKQF